MHPLLTVGQRLVVGHRGNRAHAPENTLIAFEQAVALGVDAIELDVHLSADGEVIVIHDPSVDRTTDGGGDVKQLTWAALAALDAGYRFTVDGGRSFPWRGRGVGIPRLADVLAQLPETFVLIEIKVAEAAAAVRRIIEAADATARCIVESFHHEAGAAFAGSPIAVGASQRDALRVLPRALLGLTATRPGFAFMAIPDRYYGVPIPVAGMVAATRAARAPVHVWTVNDPREAERFWADGVSGIITDDPARMLELRRSLT